MNMLLLKLHVNKKTPFTGQIGTQADPAYSDSFTTKRPHYFLVLKNNFYLILTPYVCICIYIFLI